ncbi:nickel transporter permease [Fuchsiella alkaliacetigena]|uniref:nickel transporter permease n=1 Tax=Fuchsiella alkaliacetigena TaxID=957042 RepID=UPI00200A65D0|nr:nickel transporter permease [Fuchsiella alkaliacetigena]MCK8825586.1 ABC transporter permease [Fuchsiella alkaliacetigena]
MLRKGGIKIAVQKKQLKNKFFSYLSTIDKLSLIGLVIILFFIIFGILAPFLVPNDPIEIDLTQRFLAPNGEFLMGTDHLGRDVFSRLLYGIRTSLSTAFLVLIFSMVVSVIVGTTAGYFGGKIDQLVIGVIDTLLAFPGLVLALVIAGLLGPSLINLMIALAVTHWVGYARIIRGMVMSIKEQEYILAARACGAGDLHIILVHILPNIISPVLVLATLDMGYIILSISGLSFLGLGAQPPTPEWGVMLNAGRPYMQLAPWLMFFPGMAIFLIVLAFNILGDGLRDIFDPRDVA